MGRADHLGDMIDRLIASAMRSENLDVMSLCGSLKSRTKGVTLEDMEEAIRKGVTGSERPTCPELLDWQKALLDQRLKEAEEHPDDWVTWDEVRQRLEQRLHRDK